MRSLSRRDLTCINATRGASSGEGAAENDSLASAIGRLLGFGPETKDWPIDEAVREWGVNAITSFGSNSRVRALKARKMLGWAPKGPALLEDVEQGSYRDALGRG